MSSKFAHAGELQAIYDAALRKQRSEYGAAPTTVEALMHSLRERGIPALAEENTQQRLGGLSSRQVREVIARLERLRDRYPLINDYLIATLREQIK